MLFRSLAGACTAALVWSTMVLQAQPSARLSVVAPAPGTPVRRQVLGAVRSALQITSQFKVAHLAVWGSFAFVRAGEVVADGEQLQETDLFVEALLEQRAGQWVVRELWNLSTHPDGEAHEAFLRRVGNHQRTQGIPLALFPHDLRATIRP
ncbi:MAG: hypothetical protein JNJ98_15290 [Gemmatimonadetes bacterium]|nr:hypothetical protein [Gemmatimonadota bacterium]